MSYVLAFAGFAALIILHEFGHFAAAKAVGMRVERFSLFFGPMLVKFRRGETEYGIGPIPLGGYVKISGMNPREEVPEHVVARSYWAQPVWKRVVVIAAGPAMNLLIAFLLLWGIFWANGWVDQKHADHTVGQVETHMPAAAVIRPGDRVLSVDGVTNPDSFPRTISAHRCAVQPPVNGCVAASPARLVVQRNGLTTVLLVYPRYDATKNVEKTRIGVGFDDAVVTGGPVAAASTSVSQMWEVTTKTLSTFGSLFVSSKARSQINSGVGAYTITSQAFSFSLAEALGILALISLSLAIINLFPFLPLDGGHIFWALAEKARGGRPVPVSVMEQASIVGIALVGFVFLIGLNNDIHTLTHGGFHIR